MKIGITGDVNLSENSNFKSTRAHMAQRTLINVLLKHDITPVIFPIAKPKMAKDLLSIVDGFIMTGGPDVAPDFYGEEPIQAPGMTYRPRDEFELELVKQANQIKKPILAICRGLQIVNVAFGGTLYQDLNTQFKAENTPLIQHIQNSKAFLPTHHINVSSNSEIIKSCGSHPLVNSLHHQAAKDVANNLYVTAKAPDGVIEGLENDDASIQCVQWHPENTWDTQPEEEQIFIDFFRRIEKIKSKD